MPIFDTYAKGVLFRWYDNPNKRNREKSYCKNELEYKLITPATKLLPFMIMRTVPGGGAPTSWLIKDLDGNTIYDLAANIGMLNVTTANGVDYIYYNGVALTGSMLCGFYTSEIQDSVGTYYSEVFYITGSDISTFVKLSWTNQCDIGNILYQTGFHNEFYFDPEADVMEADYKSLTESKENGEREQIPVFRKITDLYFIETGLVPHYVLQALEHIPLHDTITITLKNGQGSGVIKQVTMKHTWEFISCYANVNLSFEVDSVIKSSCCDELTIGGTGGCLSLCMTVEEDKFTYEIGHWYMDDATGGLKQYTGTGFIYNTCAGYVLNADDGNSIWVFSQGDGVWVKGNQLVVGDLGAGNIEITGRLMPGVIASIEVNYGFGWNMVDATVTSGELIAGLTYAGTLSATFYEFRLTPVTDLCSLGEVLEDDVTIGQCTYYQVLDISPYDVGTDKWTEIETFNYGVVDISALNIALDDVAALKTELDALNGDNFTVALISGGTAIQIVVLLWLPASEQYLNVKFNAVGVGTVTAAFTTNCP